MAEMRYAPEQRTTTGAGQKRWWDRESTPADKAWSAIQQDVEYIRQQQRHLRDTWTYCMELYGQGNVSGVDISLRDASLQDIAGGYTQELGGITRFNLAAALTDTAASMIVHSPAIPIIMTTGGDFGLVRKAKKKTQILQGQCKEIATEAEKMAMLDAIKVGTGFVASFEKDGKVECEHVHPLQTFIEHTDGLDGYPQAVHRTKLVSREVLSEAYPKHEKAIHVAPFPLQYMRDYFIDRSQPGSLHVEVIESHYFAYGKRKGRHCITVHGATLLDEEYDGRSIEDAYAVFRYRERDKGFYGIGVIERHIGSQLRINELISRVDRGQDLGTNVVLLVPQGAGGEPVGEDRYSNEIGIIIPVPGLTAPQLVKWEGTQYDLQDQISIELDRSMMVEGITPDMAGGAVPSNKSSGVAVRAADDVQSRRLIRPVENFQKGCMDTARLIIRVNDALAKKNAKYTVRGRARSGTREELFSMPWKELGLPEGDERAEMMPMSALPTTPQGKWAAVQEWIEAGWIDRNHGMQLLEFPDLSAYADMANAHIDLAKWQIEQILDGNRVFPIPRQDPNIAINLGTRSMAKLVTMNPPDDVVDLLEYFISDCERLVEQAANDQMAAQQAAAGAAPPAPGMGSPPPGLPGMPPPGPMPPLGQPGVVPPAMGMPPGPAQMQGMPPGMGLPPGVAA